MSQKDSPFKKIKDPAFKNNLKEIVTSVMKANGSVIECDNSEKNGNSCDIYAQKRDA